VLFSPCAGPCRDSQARTFSCHGESNTITLKPERLIAVTFFLLSTGSSSNALSDCVTAAAGVPTTAGRPHNLPINLLTPTRHLSNSNSCCHPGARNPSSSAAVRSQPLPVLHPLLCTTQAAAAPATQPAAAAAAAKEEEATPKLWGGRFTGKVDPLMEKFNASLPLDKRMWAEDIRVSRQ
jgi:hypothetical protein